MNSEIYKSNNNFNHPSNSDGGVTVSELTKKKLKEKLDMLKIRRTGVDRRKMMNAYKKEGKPMKNFSRDAVHQILQQAGINDEKFEASLVKEIINGNITNHDQLIQLITRMFQQKMTASLSANQNKPSSQVDAKISSIPSSTPSSVPPMVVPTNENVPSTSSTRKPLKKLNLN